MIAHKMALLLPGNEVLYKRQKMSFGLTVESLYLYKFMDENVDYWRTSVRIL